MAGYNRKQIKACNFEKVLSILFAIWLWDMKWFLSIVIHFSGLRQSFSICEGQGAGGISRAGQADLPVGCEHTDSSDRLQ